MKPVADAGLDFLLKSAVSFKENAVDLNVVLSLLYFNFVVVVVVVVVVVGSGGRSYWFRLVVCG